MTQMALILLLGHALAHTGPVRALLVIATIVLVAGALALVAPKAGDRIAELPFDARRADDVDLDDAVVTPADRPFELIALTKNAAAKVGEILLQFPLYAGIMGIMGATGLIDILSDGIVSIATPATFGLLALLSAGLVSFFVPSGGGQFACRRRSCSTPLGAWASTPRWRSWRFRTATSGRT